MKKKLLLLFLCACLSLPLSACSEIKKEDFDALQAEKSALETSISILQDKYDSIDREYTEISEEYEALKKDYKKYKKKMKPYEEMEVAEAEARKAEATATANAKSAQDEATNAIRKVWDFENGVLAQGATRELWNTAEAKINALSDEAVKNSLTPALTASNDALVQLEEAAAEEQARQAAVENASMEQKNALDKAESYLGYTAFSYSGLISQLEYEGFSTESATYAADNCGADWNEQAAAKAQSYLEYTSFSRQSLIEQLEYEGFTSEQAEYGVSSVGY